MFSVALYCPEIPPNTGNIIRLCANTGFALHLVGPLGFSMEEKQLRRAGLDYHQYCAVREWQGWDAFREGVPGRLVSFSTKDSKLFTDFSYLPGDVLLFGSETRGLPGHVRESVPAENRLTIPMQGGSRSLNLSNSVAIGAYEAWRQQNFARRPLSP